MKPWNMAMSNQKGSMRWDLWVIVLPAEEATRLGPKIVGGIKISFFFFFFYLSACLFIDIESDMEKQAILLSETLTGPDITGGDEVKGWVHNGWLKMCYPLHIFWKFANIPSLQLSLFLFFLLCIYNLNSYYYLNGVSGNNEYKHMFLLMHWKSCLIF